MKKEAIETFLKRKKETSAMKEAIEAAKAKNNEKSKTTRVTPPPPKGVVGHSKKPTWVKVIEDGSDEGEETDREEEQPKIKAILTSTDDDVSSSASKTRTSKAERVAQSHKVTNFGDIAKAKAKKEEALAYARKLFNAKRKSKPSSRRRKRKNTPRRRKPPSKRRKK